MERKEKGEVEMVRRTESEQVDEDVTGWVEVRRRTRRRVHEDEGGKSCKTVQIFFKMDGSRTTAMYVAPNDKVSDMMKRIPSGGDMYVTSGGRVLRRSGGLRSCGVSDGCMVQVTSRMRGGRRHKDKKSKAEKKQVTRQEPVSDKGPAILEREKKDAVIQMLEGTEEYREIIERIAETRDEEYGMQRFKAGVQEKSGLDKEHTKMLECGVRWVVEARRKGKGEEQEQRRREEQ